MKSNGLHTQIYRSEFVHELCIFQPHLDSSRIILPVSTNLHQPPSATGFPVGDNYKSESILIKLTLVSFLFQVFYSIETQPDGSDRFFSIDKESGEIYTKMEFDREEKQAYALLVRAYDGAPSDRPNMRHGAPNFGELFSMHLFV